jgi:hypothetical protein
MSNRIVVGKEVSKLTTEQKKAKTFIQKVIGSAKEELCGDEYSAVYKMLELIEPIEVSNNQRNITSKYRIGDIEYHLYDLSDGSKEIYKIISEEAKEEREDELPRTLADAIENNLVPWTEYLRKDFHVAVFIDNKKNNKLIFAPQYNTYGVLRDCFSDATNMGQAKVESKEWKSFKIKHGVTPGKKNIDWPHVVLTWKD